MADRPAAVIAAALLALVAVAYTEVVIRRDIRRPVSYDVYGAQVPDVLYALDSWKQGHGLLWNPLQNCGQPFLPGTMLGPLYPPHALLVLLDIASGILVLTALHLTLAGCFTYWLCREYGLAAPASMAGGLAFMLGGSTLNMAAWMPTTILGAYVWLPAAMAMVERILRRPSYGNAVGLGVCLTLQFLAGFPQTTLFTYLVIGLRVAWELATRPASRSIAVVGTLLLGGALPVGLGAAHLLPALEFGAQSVRGTGVTTDDVVFGGTAPWAKFRFSAGAALNGYIPIFGLLPTALTLLMATDRRHWRVGAFYLAALGLFLALAFHEPLYGAFFSIPPLRVFRHPLRFLWVVTFLAAVPLAFGVDALRNPAAARWTTLVLRVAAVAAGTALFALIRTRELATWEIVCFGLAAGSILLPILVPRSGTLAIVGIVALLGYSAFRSGSTHFLGRFGSLDPLYAQAEAFADVKSRMTTQDRLHHFAPHGDYSMIEKSPSIFGVRSIMDYEAQTSRRYAEIIVRTFRGTAMGRLHDYYFLQPTIPKNLPLFNLLAARWTLLDERALQRSPDVPPEFRLVAQREHLRLYENPAALPRAFFVPQLEVVASPDTLRERLAAADHDPRRVVLVEQPPADGFLGADPSGTAEVRDLRDESEVLRLRVIATTGGFLFLSDQDYPGWEATVNGSPVEILRANYAFRAIRVPAGESEVVFRYRPRSWRAGLALTTASITILLAVAAVRRRRARVSR